MTTRLIYKPKNKEANKTTDLYSGKICKIIKTEDKKHTIEFDDGIILVVKLKEVGKEKLPKKDIQTCPYEIVPDPYEKDPLKVRWTLKMHARDSSGTKNIVYGGSFLTPQDCRKTCGNEEPINAKELESKGIIIKYVNDKKSLRKRVKNKKVKKTKPL